MRLQSSFPLNGFNNLSEINKEIKKGWDCYEHNVLEAEAIFSKLFIELTQQNKTIPSDLLTAYAYICTKLGKHEKAIELIKNGNSNNSKILRCRTHVFRSYGITLCHASRSKMDFQKSLTLNKAIVYLLEAKNTLNNPHTKFVPLRYHSFNKSIHFTLIVGYQYLNDHLKVAKIIEYLVKIYGDDDIQIKIHLGIHQINIYSALTFLTFQQLADLYEKFPGKFTQKDIDQILCSVKRLISGNNYINLGWKDYLNNLIQSVYSESVYIAYIRFCLYDKNDTSSAVIANKKALSKFPKSPDIQLLNLEVLIYTFFSNQSTNQYHVILSIYQSLKLSFLGNFIYEKKLQELMNKNPQFLLCKNLEKKLKNNFAPINLKINDMNSGRKTPTTVVFYAHRNIEGAPYAVFVARIQILRSLLEYNSERNQNFNRMKHLLFLNAMEGDGLSSRALKNINDPHMVSNYIHQFSIHRQNFLQHLKPENQLKNLLNEEKNVFTLE